MGLSELWDKKIASFLDLPPILDATNRAPSVLNGGLGKINPAYWIGCLAMVAITAFAAQEFVAGTAVIDHAGLFFKPITQVLSDLNPGYYIPSDDELQNAVVGTLEAAKSVVPPVEVVSEAVTAVVPPVDAVSAAATAVAPTVDTVSAVSVEAAAVVPPVPAAPSAELITAQERIVELEAKLSKIAEFSR